MGSKSDLVFIKIPPEYGKFYAYGIVLLSYTLYP